MTCDEALPEGTLHARQAARVARFKAVFGEEKARLDSLWVAYADECHGQGLRPTAQGFLYSQYAAEAERRDTYGFWTHAGHCTEEDDPYCRGECTKLKGKYQVKSGPRGIPRGPCPLCDTTALT
jgi:hypothetical protein